MNTQVSNRPYHGNYLEVTITLIIINVICYFISMMLPVRTWQELALSRNALDSGRWISFISSMFMHGSLSHLGNNMLTLFFLGAQLERRLSKHTYLLMYLASGILAGIFFLLVGILTGFNVSAVGASGAIFGLFGVYGYIIFRNHMLYGRGDGSPKTEIQVGLFAVLMVENIGYGLVTPGVANSAHIGGLLAGFLLAYIFVHPDLSGLARTSATYRVVPSQNQTPQPPSRLG